MDEKTVESSHAKQSSSVRCRSRWHLYIVVRSSIHVYWFEWKRPLIIDHRSPFWSNCTICINGYLPWANNCYKPSKETVHFNVLSLQWLPIGHKLCVLFAFIPIKFLTNMKAINLLTIVWTLITIWRYNRFEVHSYCATATGTELFLVWTLSSIYTQSILRWSHRHCSASPRIQKMKLTGSRTRHTSSPLWI